MFMEISWIWKPLRPAAYNTPTTEPALVPTTMVGEMPCASSALITPTWAKPRAAPPPKARAIFAGGRATTGKGTGGGIFVTGFGGSFFPGEGGLPDNKKKKNAPMV